MAKYEIYGYEIDSEDVIKEAAIGAGLAFVIVGIKKFFDARSLRFERDYMEYEDDEDVDEYLLEEYKEDVKDELRREERNSVIKGALSVACGSILAAVGIIGFTPLKKIVVEKLPEVDLKNKVASLGIKDKLADIAIKDRLADIDIKDIKDRFTDIAIKDKLTDFDIKNKLSGIDIKSIKRKLSDAEFIRLISRYDIDDLKERILRITGR